MKAHGFSVALAETVGLKGVSNGNLLLAAEGRFDVLVTRDKNLPHQNKLAGRYLAVLIFRIRGQKSRFFPPYVPAAAKILENIKPGTIEYVGNLVPGV